MSEPKEIRRMVNEIREALDRHPREALAEILTYIFKEYVVEGASALGAQAASVPDVRSQLEGMSFAELVTWLQLHSDQPELALFEVQGERVSLRSGGRAIPIEAPRARAEEPLPPPQPAAPAPAPAPPAVQPAPPVQARPTPPPQPQPATQQQQQAPTPAQPQQPAAKPEAAANDGDRFSLLEVD